MKKLKLCAIMVAATLLITSLQPFAFAADAQTDIESEVVYTQDEDLICDDVQTDLPISGTNSFKGEPGGVNFYDQLDNDTQRAVYNALKSVDENSKSLVISLEGDLIQYVNQAESLTTVEREAIREQVRKNVQIAIEAFQKDCPEIFWISFGDGGSTYKYTLSGDEDGQGNIIWSVIKITFNVVVKSCYSNDLAGHIDTFQTALQNFPVTTTSRFLKVKSIHDEIAKRVVTNPNTATSADAYGALVLGEASSVGYAKAFKCVCDIYDVPCVIVYGQRESDYGLLYHMWNYVRMDDGEWYAVDTTLDDGTTVAYMVIYNDYLLAGSDSYDTFFGLKKFSQSHIEINDFSGSGYKNFSYPVLSTSSFSVDYGELLMMLKLRPAYSDEYYTKESVTAFWDALEAGEEIDSSLDKSQQGIIDEAANAIRVAYQNLTLQHFLIAKADSNIVVDMEQGLIYGISEEATLESFYENYVDLIDDVTLSFESDKTCAGTGVKLQVYKNGILKESYTLLIFGDIDGDGLVDGNDAVLLNAHLGGLLALSSNQSFVADCNHDGSVTVEDAKLMFDSGLKIDFVNQSAK